MVWWPFGKKAADQHSQNYPQQANPIFSSPSTESKTFFRSYSSSRTCRPDQEDPNYLICKEKVQDGNDSYEKEERIPANEYANSSSSFRSNLGSSDAEFNDFMNQSANMFRTAHNMFSMFDNFFNVNPAFGTQQRHEDFMPAYYQQNPQNRPQSFPQNKKENPRYYFSTKQQADYSVKDL